MAGGAAGAAARRAGRPRPARCRRRAGSSASRSAPPAKAYRPALTSRIASSSARRVAGDLGLHDALDAAVGGAHDAAVAARVRELHRGQRRRGAGLLVRGDHAGDRVRRDQRHVAVDHQHRRVVAVEQRGGRGHRVAGPARLAPGRRPRRPRAGARRAAAFGLSTTITRPAPAARAASSGHRIIGRPQIGCRTLGSVERIRVPSPAARITTVGAGTMARHRSIGRAGPPMGGGVMAARWPLEPLSPGSSPGPPVRPRRDVVAPLRDAPHDRYAAPPMRARLAAATLAALLLPAAAAAAAQSGDPIMPLGEVRVRDAVHRATPWCAAPRSASFAVEVLDVVDDRTTRDGPRILVRASGPAVDETGIGPGFSGLADPLPRRGRRAAEHRRDLGGDRRVRRQGRAGHADRGDPRPSRRRAARRARAAPLARARPLATPLTVSGLNPRLGAPRCSARRRSRGARVLATPAGPLGSLPAQTLRPGSAFGVGYAEGDLAASAIGTVSYVDGGPGLGLRASARRRRAALAAAAGRLRLPRRRQPAGRRRVDRHLQVRRRRATRSGRSPTTA